MTDADLLHNPYAELTLKRHRKEGRRPLPSRAAAFFFACSTRLHTQSTNQSKTNLIYAMLFLMLSCFACVCDVVLSQIIAMYMFYVYHLSETGASEVTATAEAAATRPSTEASTTSLSLTATLPALRLEDL